MSVTTESLTGKPPLIIVQLYKKKYFKHLYMDSYLDLLDLLSLICLFISSQ